jgi:AcrR family transcriptional regulator
MPAATPKAKAHQDAIRAALVDLSFEHGFASLDVEALCAGAGVSRADFDALYSDLGDCFHQVYACELARYQREAAAARENAIDWRGRVRATAYALYRFLAADERLRHLTVVEVRAADERTQLLLGAEIEALFDLIDQGRAEPGAPAGLTRATAEQVGGGIFNQMYVAAGRGGEMPAEAEIVPQMMYGVVLPYLGPGAAAEELRIPPPPAAPAALAR